MPPKSVAGAACMRGAPEEAESERWVLLMVSVGRVR
jgi:hypothetical protein